MRQTWFVIGTWLVAENTSPSDWPTFGRLENVEKGDIG
jgi:hypothetical protein